MRTYSKLRLYSSDKIQYLYARSHQQGDHILLTDAAAHCCANFFGRGTGPIFLDDLSCSGHEASLFDCPHRGIGSHNCGHGEDAGAVCRSRLNPLYRVNVK